MVSYFASNNSDSHVADARTCSPDAHLTPIANSTDERGFKFTQFDKSAQSTISTVRKYQYVEIKN